MYTDVLKRKCKQLRDFKKNRNKNLKILEELLKELDGPVTRGVAFTRVEFISKNLRIFAGSSNLVHLRKLKPDQYIGNIIEGELFLIDKLNDRPLKGDRAWIELKRAILNVH